MLAASIAPSAAPHQFFQQILESLFKIAAVLGARHKAGHIQCQQPSAFQRLRNIPGRDALGKTLSKSCLANARFPHKAGVIFLAAAEDLDHTVQLCVPAEYRIQFPFGGAAGQVAAIFIAGTAPAGCTDRCAGLIRKHKLPGKLAAFPHSFGERQAHGGQQQPGSTAVILQHGAEQVFRFCTGNVCVLCPDDGVIHRAAQIGCKGAMVQMPCRGTSVLGQLTAHRLFRDPLSVQEPCCGAVFLPEHSQQKMPGIGFFAAEVPSQLHSRAQQPG